jgi:hypothetical protein
MTCTYREEREGRQEKGCIPLLFVNYIRTAPEFGSNTFEIGTFARKFVFRAATAELAKQWLLGMHCSIAQVCAPSPLTHTHNTHHRTRTRTR